MIPHEHYYLWQSNQIRLHVLSDSLIALADYSIPFTLFYFVRRRQDLPCTSMFPLFSTVMVACGTTHLMEVWTLWHPAYWLSGALKLVTGVIPLVTAMRFIVELPISPLMNR
ncbi:hypothetical protein [Kovacikia minuta]|uniref:hypothetical protein n=1 Tax=Kovacikia minuta TaxID=2931930 RepID=UPI0028F4160C|nr:hypothetical protein [Kovacikia minuta]